MPPRLYEKGRFVRHPLEQRFNAGAWDILSAIERGFRAQVDVKGKLAEWFLFNHLTELQRKGLIQKVDWRDRDGIPDFLIEVRGKELQMECKNIRSGKVGPFGWRVEIQKTRSQIGGGPARGYRADEFDILAACLFNQSGNWSYLYSAAINLDRRPLHPDYLVIMQKVPATASGHWRANFEDAINEVIGP
jgi:hypothetical protein